LDFKQKSLPLFPDVEEYAKLLMANKINQNIILFYDVFHFLIFFLYHLSFLARRGGNFGMLPLEKDDFLEETIDPPKSRPVASPDVTIQKLFVIQQCCQHGPPPAKLARSPLDLLQMGKFWKSFHLVLGNQRAIAQEELKTQHFRACGGQ